jgi:hypothetical protein
MRRLIAVLLAVGSVGGLVAAGVGDSPPPEEPQRPTFYAVSGMDGDWVCRINDAEDAPPGDPSLWSEAERQQYCD